MIDQLKTGAIKNQYPTMDYYDLIVPLPSDAIETLLARPDVISIVPYGGAKPMD